MFNKRAVLATGLEAADLNIPFSSLMMEMDTLFLCTVENMYFLSLVQSFKISTYLAFGVILNV